MRQSMRLMLAAAASLLAVQTASAQDAPGQTAPGQPYKTEQVDKQVAKVEAKLKRGKLKPDWDSLGGFKAPEWFRDAKFGIFIHWGPYAVPGFANEWYSRNMYLKGNSAFTYHENVYGPQSRFGYKDFIPKFKAERFDAKEWIALFKDAGARYVIPVAEHCDGFAMYASAMTDWNSTVMGPKRDVAGELASATRAAGLHFGLSSHRAEHYWWFNGGRSFDSDVNDPRYASLYGPAAPRTLPADNPDGEPNPSHLENWFPPDDAFLRDWLARATEIVDKYQPELVYFDWWTMAPRFDPYLRKFSAYYYNEAKARGQGPAITYKGEHFPANAALYDVERGKLDALRLLPWQTDTSVSIGSWGYAQNDRYRTPKSLIGDLIDVVSKNGNLLLNVGPRADGSIPEEAVEVLRGIGAWLAVNGEAIYDTRPWKYYGEGTTFAATGEKSEGANKAYNSGDIRFTTRGETLYAMGLDRPADNRVLIKTLYTGTPYLERPIASIELLGGGKVEWQQTDKGLAVTLPAASDDNRMPYALRIRFARG